MPLCGKLCCSAVNGGCFSKTGKMTIELLEIAKAMYSNGNAITCSDMLKILFFTDTWASYFIPSPGRTLSAGTLGLPIFGSLNEIQHFMITMSCCICLEIYTSLWHYYTILSWQKEIFQKYINFTSKFIYIIRSIYEMMLNLWIYYIIFCFMSPTLRLAHSAHVLCWFLFSLAVV